jgi:hypothetical protein
MFSFETKVGSGKGMLGLTLGADGVYKCHAVHLSLQELKGLEESIDPQASGCGDTLVGDISQGSWH